MITSKSKSGSRSKRVGRASRGGFTRQAVNLARFEAFTKVRPVRLPVRSRQAGVRSCCGYLGHTLILKPLEVWAHTQNRRSRCGLRLLGVAEIVLFATAKNHEGCGSEASESESGGFGNSVDAKRQTLERA